MHERVSKKLVLVLLCLRSRQQQPNIAILLWRQLVCSFHLGGIFMSDYSKSWKWLSAFQLTHTAKESYTCTDVHLTVHMKLLYTHTHTTHTPIPPLLAPYIHHSPHTHTHTHTHTHRRTHTCTHQHTHMHTAHITLMYGMYTLRVYYNYMV